MDAQESQAATMEELAKFRKVPFTPMMELEIPTPHQYRRFTDKKYFILLLAITAIWLPFIIYSFVFSNIQRLDGYDDCGNVCGVSNSFQNVECSGKDMTHKPYLALQETSIETELRKQCVDTCDVHSVPVGHFCIPKGDAALVQELKHVLDFWKEVKEDISKAWGAIFICILISVGLTIFAIVLYRYCVAFAVWFALIAYLVIFCRATVSLWRQYYAASTLPTEETKNVLTPLIFAAIIVTVISLLYTIFLLCFRKKIGLIIQLFREASVAIFSMPSIALLPVAGSILQILFVSIFLWILATLISAGSLTEIQPGVYDYIPNAAIRITCAISVFLFAWYSQFVVDCQYMIVSGGISAWFFSTSKPETRASLMTFAKNVFRFHLGTVTIGSLVLTLTRCIKLILRIVISNQKLKCLMACCTSSIEMVTNFLSRYGYILTALHGEPYFKSTKRAVNHMSGHLKEIIALNSLGCFVLIMTQTLIAIVSGNIAFFVCFLAGMSNLWVPTIICAYAAALIASSFFSVYESAIDTIFICFCEDNLLHDGTTKPYASPRGLKQFIQDSKRILRKQ